MTVLLLVALVAALVVAAIEWARLLVAAADLASRLARPEGARPHTPQKAEVERSSQGPQGRPPQGVDGSRNGSYECPPTVAFSRRDYHGAALLALPLGSALQPDFDAFFGGLEVAVGTGGVLVIAVVVVMTIRRFVSF